jgi:hypothetical protein
MGGFFVLAHTRTNEQQMKREAIAANRDVFGVDFDYNDIGGFGDMTPEHIKRLLAEGEGLTIEYKECVGGLNNSVWRRSVHSLTAMVGTSSSARPIVATCLA